MYFYVYVCILPVQPLVDELISEQLSCSELLGSSAPACVSDSESGSCELARSSAPVSDSDSESGSGPGFETR